MAYPTLEKSKAPSYDHRIDPHTAQIQNTLRVRVLSKKVNREAIYPP